MSDIRKLTPNVISFLSKAAIDYGKIQSETFSQNMFCGMIEGPNTSPIEDIFYIACHVISESCYMQLNPEPWVDDKGHHRVGYGIHMYQQFKIGKYRVDFLLKNIQSLNCQQYTQVIVELDGHDFHDKDKHQRAYEKSRDRFFVRNGYKVLHFTGSEVVSDPYKVAHEALSTAGMVCDEYCEENPLGIE